MKKALIVMLNDIARFQEVGSTNGKAVVEPVFVSTLKHAHEDGYKIFIMVDNSDKTFEYFTSSELFDIIIKQLQSNLIDALNGQVILLTYVSHYINKYKMPSPFSLYEMAIRYNISLRDSIMIGGHLGIMETAYNAGIGTYIETVNIYEAQG